ALGTRRHPPEPRHRAGDGRSPPGRRPLPSRRHGRRDAGPRSVGPAGDPQRHATHACLSGTKTMPNRQCPGRERRDIACVALLEATESIWPNAILADVSWPDSATTVVTFPVPDGEPAMTATTTSAALEYVLHSLDASWCYDKWEKLPNDGNRYEVID